MQFKQIGRVDVRQTSTTVGAFIGDHEILFKRQGGPWVLSQDAELQDIITAACALLRVTEEQEVAA